jgi:hypothetical protein
MRGIKATKLLIAPLLVAPMLVAGFAIGQTAAVAKTKPPKIVCMSLTGTESSPITISDCTGQPAGATQATSPSTVCVSDCTVTETWNDAGSTTTTQTYNAKVTTGKKAKKCPAGDDQAVEKGKVTAGYGDKGKSSATVCVDSEGNITLAPGTSLNL